MADSNSTKSALADAMKKLMVCKSFAKISISDLCEECGLNRKSFYYHFKDKYDLVNWIFYVDFLTNMGGKNFENEWDVLVAVCNISMESELEPETFVEELKEVICRSSEKIAAKAEPKK